jgi:aryl-alcohol dehydrogenase-like predicted oxidoreductase
MVGHLTDCHMRCFNAMYVRAPVGAAARELGRTGLVVSRIGLGLAAVGRPAYITLGRATDLGVDRNAEALRTRSHMLLDAARAAGVRYVDAARSYGRAEEFLGAWLLARGLEPGAMTVGSKWGYTYTGEWRLDARVQEVKDLSVETLRRQYAESRALLGDHLGLYQIHSATLESGVLEDQGVLRHLQEIKEEGLAIGLTVTGARQSQTVDRALALGLFDAIQATWNLLERSAGEALQRAHARGLGVIVKEALANGRLTASGAEEPLISAAREHKLAPDALALAVVLDQPWADVVLSGAVTVEQLRSNMEALDITVDRPLQQRLRHLTERPEQYWSERARLKWA